jgi:hypothetical protein
MSGDCKRSSERAALLRWTARVGVVSADALATLDEAPIAAARSRLGHLTRERLLARHRLLADEPPLYTITRAGLRQIELSALEPGRLSAGGAAHALACARAAAFLQRRYPDQLVLGERELRRRERVTGTLLASIALRGTAARHLAASPPGPRTHRPDLVLWPAAAARLPVAVEVELTVKAPQRLAAICRAWGRARHVAGVIYFASPPVRRALERATAAVDVGRIVVLPLDALALGADSGTPIARTVPSEA